MKAACRAVDGRKLPLHCLLATEHDPLMADIRGTRNGSKVLRWGQKSSQDRCSALGNLHDLWQIQF